MLMMMTSDTSMIHKNTGKMTNSGNDQTTYPVTRNGETATTVFSPNSNGECFLLMDAETSFDHNGITYMNAWHHLISNLADIMGDHDMATVIRYTNRVESLVTLEDRTINVNGTVFADVKDQVYYIANLLKFMNNNMMAQKLLDTGSTTILYVHRELSAQELGNGAAYRYTDVIDDNHLGKILMEIRDTVRGRMSDATLI
jgi:predicted NAD-dependent protein-ADP-ribosyltransferase YbiA (DUF1768 family)